MQTTRTTRVFQPEGGDERRDVLVSRNRLVHRRTEDGWHVVSTPLGGSFERNGKEIAHALAEAWQRLEMTFELDRDGHVRAVRGFEDLRAILGEVVEGEALKALSATVDPDRRRVMNDRLLDADAPAVAELRDGTRLWSVPR